MTSKRTPSSNQQPSTDPFPLQGGLGNLGGQGSANPQLLNELQSEISTEAAPLLQFILKHAVAIMLCLGLFVVILGGVGAYNWHNERVLDEAQGQLSSIILTKQGEERVKALEEFYPTAPASIKNGLLMALAEVNMQLKAYELAAKHFGELAAIDVNGALGLLAGLNQGQALVLAGKPAEAVKVLEPLVAKAPTLQGVVIQQALADAALQAGDVEKARTTFQALAAATQGPESVLFRYRADNLSTSDKATAPVKEAAPAQTTSTDAQTDTSTEK